MLPSLSVGKFLRFLGFFPNASNACERKAKTRGQNVNLATLIPESHMWVLAMSNIC